MNRNAFLSHDNSDGCGDWQTRRSVRNPELAKAGVRQVHGIVGRRKRHNEFEYEVWWLGTDKDSAEFVPKTELEEMIE